LKVLLNAENGNLPVQRRTATKTMARWLFSFVSRFGSTVFWVVLFLQERNGCPFVFLFFSSLSLCPFCICSVSAFSFPVLLLFLIFPLVPHSFWWRTEDGAGFSFRNLGLVFFAVCGLRFLSFFSVFFLGFSYLFFVPFSVQFPSFAPVFLPPAVHGLFFFPRFCPFSQVFLSPFQSNSSPLLAATPSPFIRPKSVVTAGLLNAPVTDPLSAFNAET
jgi:hypothetical protein